MKRKNLFTVALITCGISLAACSSTQSANSSKTTNSDADAKISDLQKQLEELKKENEDLRSQTDDNNQDNATPTEASDEKSKGIAIKKGDVISTDTMEITINNVEFSYDVLPDDVSGFYTHYPADNGKVYIHIDADVKNLAKQNLACSEIMNVVADYNNGYTYNSQAVPEDSSTGFTYANITAIDPLATLGVHWLIECPQEVEETENPLSVTFTPFNSKDTYILTIR